MVYFFFDGLKKGRLLGFVDGFYKIECGKIIYYVPKENIYG